MNIALILSGGTGMRLGADIPKQYIEVAGKPVIVYCMETLFKHKYVDAIHIVADLVWQEKIRIKKFYHLRGNSMVFPNREEIASCRY